MDLSIGFSPAQQSAMVGHCFVSEEFFLKCKSKIKPEWITGDLYVSHIFKELIFFYDNYKKLPASGDEFLSEPFFSSQKKEASEKYKASLIACLTYSTSFSLDILRPKIADFVKTTAVTEKAKEVAINVTKHNYSKAVAASYEINRLWNDADFDANPYIDFSDAVSLWTRKDADLQKFISTGSKQLDDMLGEGLKKGGNLAVIAPTFTGKSRFLITLARHIMMQDKKVLYIIHEDDPENVKKRMISSICGIGIKELTSILNKEYKCKADLPPKWTPETWSEDDLSKLYNFTVQELERAKEVLSRNMVFLSWQKAGRMFVEELGEEIRKITIEQKTKTGRGIDVIIDDYPKHLQTKLRFENERSRLGYVYSYFNTLASDLDVFVAYAVQANRSSAKLMKSGEAEHAIGLEDVGESYDIAQNAMSSVSLNRTKEDSDYDILRISIPKARDSGMNNMMITRSSYNECVLYGDAAMFSKNGLLLYSGLLNIKDGQYMGSTVTLNERVSQLERQRDLTIMGFESALPDIVRKLKGLQRIPT